VDAQGVVGFDELAAADLMIDGLYDGGQAGNVSDDPLARLLPVGNQGGFRYVGSPLQGSVRLAVLYTSGSHLDWPDALDPQTGIFTYYGDNRSPGRELHDTSRKGNLLLAETFRRCHGSPQDRRTVSPFLLFQKAAPGRRITFRGLLAPGAAAMTADDDLVAIWRSTDQHRFQNYRATFTVLDAGRLSRTWLDDVIAGRATDSDHCPPAWRAWVEGRSYEALLAPSTTVVRSKADQLPSDAADLSILTLIREHFRGREHDFERCAVRLWRLIAPSTGRCDVTQPSRDGGRDATGEYMLGPPSDPISIDFALEAKCYSPTTSVGVRDVARLISRLRHRHFGAFITTSYFDRQVYAEVRADGHPIAMVSGRDIVDVLRAHGYTDPSAVRSWLEAVDSQP
jgi:hypothetical protein